jgi:trimeric autotransporter adhesin
MKKTIVLFSIFSFSFFAYCPAQIITTVAGDSLPGYSGDGGAATATELNAPCGVAVDAKGNIYIADQSNYRVRKIDTNGVISTFAGNGIQRYSGNGGPATAAELAYPVSVTVDFMGNVFIADEYNDVIWKVDTNGIIWVFAGRGYAGYLGNGSLATGAELDNPCGVVVDDSGNVYIADSYNHEIRKVDTSGIISDFAGNGYYHSYTLGGYSGDGGPATDAELSGPTDVVMDDSGNFFIADYYNQRIRMVNTNGIITTVAGDSVRGYSGDGGAATSAELYKPYGVATSLGNLYIVDQGSERIRMVNSSGIISTIIGNGIEDYFGDGGPATAAELHYPTQMAIDASNNIYFADQYNNVIRKITQDTNTATGLDKLIAKNEKIRVFPNPSNGVFNLYLSNTNNKCNIEIFNYLGENIYNAKMNSGNTEINLGAQPNGVYLYRVLRETGGLVGEGKVIVEK